MHFVGSQKLHSLLAATTLIASLFVSPVLIAANSRGPLKEIQKAQIKVLKEELKKRQVLASLFDINIRIKKIVSERAQLDQQKMVIEEQLHQLAGQIQEQDQQLKSEQAQLRSKLITIYKFAGMGTAKVFALSKSSADIDRNLRILGKIARLDLIEIRKFAIGKEALLRRKTELDKKWNKFLAVSEKIKKREESLKKESDAKFTILEGIKKSQMFAELKMKSIRQQTIASNVEEGDQDVFDALLLPSFMEKQGHLKLPVEGKIKKKYGLLKNEEHNIVLPFKGIFLSANKGSRVHSVSSGVVSFVGEVDGYGKTLIIDHGDHYYSVYAHLEKINVEKGLEISEKSEVATVGADEGLFGEGLYFELRHFSESMDPMQWFAPGSSQTSIASNVDIPIDNRTETRPDIRNDNITDNRSHQ